MQNYEAKISLFRSVYVFYIGVFGDPPIRTQHGQL